MTKKEIIQNNRLIAKFMGVSDKIVIKYDENPKIWNCNIKYHVSWDWLMPVVKKIESLNYEVAIKGISCSIRKLFDIEPIIHLVCGNKRDKIGLVYRTIIKFIEWYNNK